MEGLGREEPDPGPPDWLRRVAGWLTGKTPQDFGYFRSRWSCATLAEVMKATDWQAHSVRGFMAGAMKKAGYTVESFKPEGGERTYRINQ